jgi:hypothetical protein
MFKYLNRRLVEVKTLREICCYLRLNIQLFSHSEGNRTDRLGWTWIYCSNYIVTPNIAKWTCALCAYVHELQWPVIYMSCAWRGGVYAVATVCKQRGVMSQKLQTKPRDGPRCSFHLLVQASRNWYNYQASSRNLFLYPRGSQQNGIWKRKYAYITHSTPHIVPIQRLCVYAKGSDSSTHDHIIILNAVIIKKTDFKNLF